jgi:hypothetical protein
VAVITNIATPASGGGVFLLSAPGDVYDLVISNNAGQTAFLGTSSRVTSSNGCPIPNGQSIKLTGQGAGSTTDLYVVVAGGAASGTVGYVLTTPR